MEVAVKYCFENKTSGTFAVDKDYNLIVGDISQYKGLYLFSLSYAVTHVIVKSIEEL